MKVKITKCPMYAENGLQVEGNQATPISDNMIMLGGKSHEQGGTDISYNGNNVEAEAGEPVSIGDKGEAIVWGNMNIPGTKQKFKNVAADLGEQEAKYTKIADKSTALLAENDPQNKWDRLAFNSGKVMATGAKYAQDQIDKKKSQLADLQRALLETAHEHNLDPQALSQGKMKKAKKGAFLPYAKQMAPWGTTLGTPKPKKGSPYFIGKPSNINDVSLADDPRSTPNVTAPNINYGQDVNLTEGVKDDIYNINNPDNSYNLGVSKPILPTNAQPLDLKQILPEIYGYATNRQVPVPQQKYNPQLYVPYQMSFQDQINDNTATSNVQRRLLSGNPALASSLGAQEYDANNKVRAGEFRTNQGIQADTINKNVALQNEAQLRNLQLSDQQYTRQSQAASRTKEINQAIMNSIASKYQQNTLNNKRLQTYENLYDYRFNDNGQANYDGGPAEFNYSGSGYGTDNGSQDPYSRQVVQTTRNGVTTRTVTPSQQDIMNKQLRNKKLMEDESPFRKYLLENLGHR